jgi:hypothetical protein
VSAATRPKKRRPMTHAILIHRFTASRRMKKKAGTLRTNACVVYRSASNQSTCCAAVIRSCFVLLRSKSMRCASSGSSAAFAGPCDQEHLRQAHDVENEALTRVLSVIARPALRAFSSEVGPGSREENASEQEGSAAGVLRFGPEPGVFGCHFSGKRRPHFIGYQRWARRSGHLSLTPTLPARENRYANLPLLNLPGAQLVRLG